MASPQQIQEFVDKQTDFAKRNQREIERRLNQQHTQEAKIIQETQSFCPVDQLKDRTVRAEDIERALKDGYGDANILKALLCLNNAVVATPPLSAGRGFGRNFKVRQYIQNLKQIGGESAYGYAMLADIKGKKQDGKGLFVVKSPQKTDRDLRAEQIHEYFCGAFGTNQLRDRIPNFSSVLGFFQCSPPYIDEKKYLTTTRSVNGQSNGQGSGLGDKGLGDKGTPSPKDRVGLTYCQNNSPENEVNYLFYENVANSVTFGDFITKGASFEDYLSILVQITLALDLAYQELDYTHYDLHHENVLVRTLDREIYIPYVVDQEGNQSYLKTRHVATIIDYGRCHIKYEGQHFGYSFPEYGILPDRSYPMYDLYKLLMFSLSAALFKKDNLKDYETLPDEELAKRNLITNPDVYNNAKELILYFYPDLPREEIRRQLTVRSVRQRTPIDQMVTPKVEASKYTVESLDYYYTLPYHKELDIRPLDFFENALAAAFPSQVEALFSQDEPADINTVYGCANRGYCKTLQEALTEYSEDDEALIRDPYMFFESVSEGSWGSQGAKQGDLTEVIRLGRSHVKEYFDQLNTDKNDYHREYQQLNSGSGASGFPARSGNLPVLSLRNADLANKTFLESYRAYVAKAVKIVDLMTSLKSIESVMKKIVEVYPNESSHYRSSVSELSQTIQREKPMVDRIINSIKIDVGYLNQLKEKDVVSRNRDAKWLFQKMPTLTAAIVRV